MQAAFILTHLTLMVYFIRRRFDLITAAFYTSSVYFLPAYFGYACYDTRDLQLDPLGTQIYFFYICYYVLLWLCSLFIEEPWLAGSGEQRLRYSQNMERSSEALARALAVFRWVVPILLPLAQILTPGGLWREDKQDLLDNASLAYPLFENAAYFYLVLAIIRGSKLDRFLSVIFCCVDLVIGFRATAAFSFLTVLAAMVMRRPKKSLLVNFMVPCIIIGAFLFGSVYKSVIVRYVADGPSAITDYLTDPKALEDSLFQNEAFSQQHIFNKVIQTEFSVPPDYTINLARLFFPGVANAIFGKSLSFNDYFQPALYPEVPWGMASNIWAEQYSIGGPFWLYGFLLLFVAVLIFANRLALRLLAAGKIDKFLIVIGIAVPVLLYMHRNDLLYELVLVRNMGILLVTAAFLSRIRWRFWATPQRRIV